MRLLVCGGRAYCDYRTLYAVLDEYLGNVSCVINGGAAGADEWARSWAKENGVPLLTCCADWKRHGKAAGPIRNQEMIDKHAPGLVIAFPGGRGTADMVRRAREAKITVREVSEKKDKEPSGSKGHSL
jgi:hypothetical protein